MPCGCTSTPPAHDDPFISSAELDAREAYPNDKFPDIDAFPIDNALAAAALPPNGVLQGATWLRWKYFSEWHERRGRGGFRPRQWGAPAEVMRAIVLCYRILGVWAEMHSPPAEWTASQALERYHGYWAELNTLRPTRPAEYVGRRDNDLGEAIQICEEEDAAAVEKLEGLVAQEEKAS